MAREWANKHKYHPSNSVLEPRVQIPRAKVIVRMVPAWTERKVAGSAAGRATLVRQVHHTDQTSAGLGRQESGFGALEEAQFGSGGWYEKSAGG
jgi:hypothetical protein